MKAIEVINFRHFYGQFCTVGGESGLHDSGYMFVMSLAENVLLCLIIDKEAVLNINK